MAKITISMNDDLVEKIDNMSKEMYMSRSAFIAQSCSDKINTATVTKAMFDLSITMRRIADNGTIDDEAKKSLEDFEVLARMLFEK